MIYELTLDEDIITDTELVYYGARVPARTLNIQLDEEGAGVSLFNPRRGMKLDDLESSFLGRTE